jgi:hypothetical protein
MFKLLLGLPPWLYGAVDDQPFGAPTPVWGLAGEIRVVATWTVGF